MNIRKPVFKSIIVLVFIVALAASFVGPANIGRVPESPPTIVPEKPNVTLILDFGGGDKTSISTAARTPYEALQLVSEVKGIKIKSKQYDFGVFVESINNLPNTKERAWIYEVNGNSPTVASDRYALKDGDRVGWTYTKPKEE